MLANAENALLAQLRNHRNVKKIGVNVDTLPNTLGEGLLQRYATDAPCFYVIPGRFTVRDNAATMHFTVAGVVRNVANQEVARKGDGIDIGCDHLVILAVRALNDQSFGGCSWSITSGETVDDEIFAKAGIAAVELAIESTPIELDFDYGQEQLSELPAFTRFHGDMDIKPQAGAVEHAKWLEEPPNYTSSKPDAQLDAQLTGDLT